MDTVSEKIMPKSPGRPPGARSRLSTQFLNDLQAAWAEHGVNAMKVMALENPTAFCQMMRSIMPNEVEIRHDIQAEWRALMGWATELPNLQARIRMAIGSEAATGLAESVETTSSESK